MIRPSLSLLAADTAPSLGAVSVSVAAPKITADPLCTIPDAVSLAPTVIPVAPYIDVAFEHEQAAPAEWTAQLRDRSPQRDDRGWLELVWESGDAWQPVQRWTLYEMLHPNLVADVERLDELRGPHPRSEGHICTSVPVSSWATRPPADYIPCHCRRKSESWRKGPCAITTLTQWKLYQRTGYVGFPFLVIQGTNGGHRFAFTHEESLLLEAEGYPTDAPGPGTLAYAPFDGRVLAMLMRFDRLLQFRNNIEEYRRAMGPDYAKHKATVQKELRKQLVAHLKEEMKDVADLFISAANKGELDNSPRTDIDYEKLDELNDESYIEKGQILSSRNAT